MRGLVEVGLLCRRLKCVILFGGVTVILFLASKAPVKEARLSLVGLVVRKRESLCLTKINRTHDPMPQFASISVPNSCC